MTAEQASFEEYVRGRYAELRRLAFLLSGEWAAADDLVQTALIRCERRWSSIGEQQRHAYVRQAVVNTTSTWRLRRRLHAPLSELEPVAVRPACLAGAQRAAGLGPARPPGDSAMTGPDLRRLLTAAVEEAERSPPVQDPLTGLRAAERDRRQRRGHLAVLAFIAFVLLLQVLPADAFGAYGPPPVATARARVVTTAPSWLEAPETGRPSA